MQPPLTTVVVTELTTAMSLIGQSSRRNWSIWTRLMCRALAKPDKMLAEKDPIAMALYAEYNNFPMPNLQLNDIEPVTVRSNLNEY